MSIWFVLIRVGVGAVVAVVMIALAARDELRA